MGDPADCVALTTSTTSGIRLVGQVDFFDSAIGDLKTQTVFTCQ